jgi:hypothetical protein
MKQIKQFLSFIWLFFYQESYYYVINRIISPDLKYQSIWLYRKDYILCFIPILVVIDHTDNIGNNANKIGLWYKIYDQRLNDKQTIIERTFIKT